jgi:magnesium transporter
MSVPVEQYTGPALPVLDSLRQAVAAGDSDGARELAARLVEEEALTLLRDLTESELSRLFAILGDESLAELLSILDERDAADILEHMSAAEAADILEEIDPDDATDIIAEVEPEFHETILVAMEPEEAAELRELMAYPPESAGGIMTPAFVAISPGLRADQAVAALRRVAEEAETVNYVYVLDEAEQLLGVLSLHRLVLTRPDTPVSELMFEDPITVAVDADQEVAARLLTEHDLLALPVVDADGKLVGIITSDDVHDVLEQEATEDIERLGGSAPLSEPYLRASPLLLFRKRIVWLLALFFAQFVTLAIYDHYADLAAEEALLSLFVPILIGTGGNVGSQTVTTVIRAMAVGEAGPRHFLRILRKEALTALALGAVMGTLMFARGSIKGGSDFGLTVGLTVLVLVMWAAVVGAMLPLILSKLKVDPAVVSAPFISSFVDGTGLIIYFSLAGVLLNLNGS